MKSSQTKREQVIKGGLLSPAWIFAGALMAATGVATPEVGSSQAQLREAEELAVGHLRETGIDLETVEVKKVSVDRLGMTHVRVQQIAGSAPLLGGEAIVHLNRD